MILEQLCHTVWEANLLLPKYGLITFTWGNVSGIDRENGLVVIKPSGVDYDLLRPEDLAVVELATGRQVSGGKNPSSDTPTHLALYRAFGSLGGIVHTHSRWATTFAQAGLGIDPMGTTQGDYFYGQIPCTRDMSAQEIAQNYEANTGAVIVEAFSGRNPDAVPAVLVRNHGPFTWGRDPVEAVHHAVVLEEVACLNLHARLLNPAAGAMPQALLDKHYLRKHGPHAYYGQG